jgi:hypothetical protein
LRRGVEELVEEVRRAGSGSSHAAAGPQLFPGRVLVVHPGRVAVVQLDVAAPLPAWTAASGGEVDGPAPPSPLRALIRTPSEWTFYGPEEEVPAGIAGRRGLRMMELLGPLPSDTVGVMAGLAAPLARAGIPLLTLSTFGTDLILVGEDRLDEACATLGRAGYRLPGAD